MTTGGCSYGRCGRGDLGLQVAEDAAALLAGRTAFEVPQRLDVFQPGEPAFQCAGRAEL